MSRQGRVHHLPDLESTDLNCPKCRLRWAEIGAIRACLPPDIPLFFFRISKIFGFIGLPVADMLGYGQNLEPQGLRGKILRNKELAIVCWHRSLGQVANRRRERMSMFPVLLFPNSE